MQTAIHIAILVAANLLLVAGAGTVNGETELLAKLEKRDASATEVRSQSEHPFDGEGPRTSRTSRRTLAKPAVARKEKPNSNLKTPRPKGAPYPRTYRPSLDLQYDD